MMAHNLAGYTWGEVDKFRKAVGKKIPAEMQAQKEKFIKGCMKTSGWTEKKATEIWTWIEPFAAYGFNKAHSVSYGRVAYQTSYLKANYPSEYMTAVLSAESGNLETVAEAIAECQRMGLAVLPPDINESFGDFTVVKGDLALGTKDKIRFGLCTIKNLGTEIAEAIVTERKLNGPFASLADFLERVKHKNLNRKSLEALIQTGALDSLGYERGQLLGNLEDLIAFHQEFVHADSDQTSLFGLLGAGASIPQLRLKDYPPASATEKLAWEKDLLGLYVSGHPLDAHRSKFKENENTIKQAKEKTENAGVIIAGLVEEVKPIITKKGSAMAFVRLADFTGAIEVVVFSDAYAKFRELLVPEKCIAIRGRLSIREGEATVVAEAIKPL
jgi:DNA polymerase-3 subunit alpha